MTIYQPFRVTSRQDDTIWYYEPLGKVWRVTVDGKNYAAVDYVKDEEVQQEYARVTADFHWYTVDVLS